MFFYFGKHCAAVNTQRLDINDPPQMGFDLKKSRACQGHIPGVDWFPSIIRDCGIKRFPHGARINKKQVYINPSLS